MALSSIVKKIPQYVPDLKKNFQELFLDSVNKDLTHEQICSISLALSYSLKNEILINNCKFEAKIYLEESNINDIRAAVIMITRNNIFYRSISQIANEVINQASIDLSDQLLSHVNIDRITLMMCMMAVSVINNCPYCIKFYSEKLMKRDITESTILTIIKMVSVLKATSDLLEIESIRNYEFISRGENI